MAVSPALSRPTPDGAQGIPPSKAVPLRSGRDDAPSGSKKTGSAWQGTAGADQELAEQLNEETKRKYIKGEYRARSSSLHLSFDSPGSQR